MANVQATAVDTFALRATCATAATPEARELAAAELVRDMDNVAIVRTAQREREQKSMLRLLHIYLEGPMVARARHSLHRLARPRSPKTRFRRDDTLVKQPNSAKIVG